MKRAALYAVLALCSFVFVHSFMPHDPRVHVGFHSPEIDFGLGYSDLRIALIKWRHMLWFALFFPLVRYLFRAPSATRKAVIAVLVAGVAIELQQTVINGRHARLADLIPNFIGTLVGALIWKMAAAFLARRRSVR